MKSPASATPIARSCPPKSMASIPDIQQLPGFEISIISPLVSPNSCKPIPIHQILGLPPPFSNKEKSKASHQMAELEEKPLAETPGRRKSSRARCNPSRNPRRCRRKKVEEVEQPEMVQESETTNMPRRRSCRLRKPRLSLINSASIVHSPKIDDDGDQKCLDGIERQLSDLVMWKDMAKSSLWFGIGSLFFLSSSFAGGLVRFRCRGNGERKSENTKLRGEDVLWALKLLLPVANFAVSKTREIFSGSPSVTIKVNELGLGTIPPPKISMVRREAYNLCELNAGFFASFTLPKLWSLHSTQMTKQADHLILKMFDAWTACSYKKFVAVSAITLFWNLTCVKFRVLAVFLGLAVLRCRQQHKSKKEE